MIDIRIGDIWGDNAAHATDRQLRVDAIGVDGKVTVHDMNTHQNIRVRVMRFEGGRSGFRLVEREGKQVIT